MHTHTGECIAPLPTKIEVDIAVYFVMLGSIISTLGFRMVSF